MDNCVFTKFKGSMHDDALPIFKVVNLHMTNTSSTSTVIGEPTINSGLVLGRTYRFHKYGGYPELIGSAKINIIYRDSNGNFVDQTEVSEDSDYILSKSGTAYAAIVLIVPQVISPWDSVTEWNVSISEVFE